MLFSCCAAFVTTFHRMPHRSLAPTPTIFSLCQSLLLWQDDPHHWFPIETMSKTNILMRLTSRFNDRLITCYQILLGFSISSILATENVIKLTIIAYIELVSLLIVLWFPWTFGRNYTEIKLKSTKLQQENNK